MSGSLSATLPLFSAETFSAETAPPFSGQLPCRLSTFKSPPLKCQGIKTRLLGDIFSRLRWSGQGCWREPFLGSGAVLFNLRPWKAFATDTNPHIITFYQALQSGVLAPSVVADYLAEEGDHLHLHGEAHYHHIRDRFNRHPNPLDFLFLNRSCFNGLVRFNRKGEFNVPFCHKTERFSRAHITRIRNQVAYVQQLLRTHDWELRHADWRECLRECQPEDFVYLDPPYPGRHTDYYQKWTDQETMSLSESIRQLPCGYALSMWQADAFRENPHLSLYTADMVVSAFSHFYHIGAREDWRHAVREVLVIKPGYHVAATALNGDGSPGNGHTTD